MVDKGNQQRDMIWAVESMHLLVDVWELMNEPCYPTRPKTPSFPSSRLRNASGDCVVRSLEQILHFT